MSRMDLLFATLCVLLAVTRKVTSSPQGSGLSPLQRLQLEQARLSDCPWLLVARPDPACREPDVEECRDVVTGEVIIRPEPTCRDECASHQMKDNVARGSDEFCNEEAPTECRQEMEYCVRLRCKPVKVKKCPASAGIETRKISTPTLSLSCFQSQMSKCILEVGPVPGQKFNACMRRLPENCTEHVSDHCVEVPVLKGKAGVCTIQIKRDCTQEDVRFCSEEHLGPKCKGACGPVVNKKCSSSKCLASVTCKKVPAPSCYRMVKERVCDHQNL